MLTEQGRGAVPVSVRCPDIGVICHRVLLRRPAARGCLAGTGCCAGRPDRSAANPLAPPSSAVSTKGPSSVIATVCSKCAAQLPSAVTTVQSSSSSRVDASAEHQHRLDCQRHPGRQHRAAARPAVVGHSRIHVHFAADAMTGVLPHDAVAACRAGSLLNGVRDVGQAAAGHRLRQPMPQRPLAGA